MKQIAMKQKSPQKIQEAVIKGIDDEYSKRFINLDPKGYFIIKLNQRNQELIAELFSNDIDDIGRAIDPETGKPLTCNTSKKRSPIKIFKGRTAKEIGIRLTECEETLPVSKIDHALYLGRELQKAENCLITGQHYIQD